MNIKDIKKLNIPSSPGCYQFFNEKNQIIYIGKAANLKSRVFSYWHKSANHTPAKSAMVLKAVKLEWIVVDSEIEALLLESNLIKKYQPYYNVLMRDDKRFNYIKISTDDEIPGVFITRKIDKTGKYFGPFTSGTAVRETVKAIRKIWPYCTQRQIKAKPCFYYQISRCTGVCGKKFSLKEYKEKIIKPIILFFEGKKDSIILNFKFKILNLGKKLKSKNLTFEEKENIIQEKKYLEYHVFNMKKVLEHTNVLSIGEKYAADVIELAKILSLLKVPERIEGYDISNIFGQEATGSMVVFSDGEPNKNEYRKFKIKNNQGEANDIGMLKEVLDRRFKHNFSSPLSERGGEEGFINQPTPTLPLKQREGKSEKWPFPDLIIIDGGKGQLNAASRVLKKYKLDIPIIAVSKGSGLRSAIAPDKLFFPGEKKPLELPLASPALHIIKRVRDEAHRFAIEYHRKLKRRKMF